MTVTLAALGFWFDDGAPSPLPLPQRLVGSLDQGTREAVLGYLRGGAEYTTCMGYSWCRFRCGIQDQAMGYCDLTDGTWLWPQGLAHYVEAHHVLLPEEFVALAVAQGGKVQPPRRLAVDTPCSSQRWLAWATARGACLDLAGWRRPDRATERQLRDQLADLRIQRILLWQPTTREVLVGGPGAGITVHGLEEPRRVQHFADFAAWPAAR